MIIINNKYEYEVLKDFLTFHKGKLLKLYLDARSHYLQLKHKGTFVAFEEVVDFRYKRLPNIAKEFIKALDYRWVVGKYRLFWLLNKRVNSNDFIILFNILYSSKLSSTEKNNMLLELNDLLKEFIPKELIRKQH